MGKRHGLCKKAGGASLGEQAGECHCSMISDSFAASRFLPWLLRDHDLGCVRQIAPFLSKLLLVVAFMTAITPKLKQGASASTDRTVPAFWRTRG